MKPQSPQNELILASTSIYRQAMLTRLCVPFTSQAPEIDETALDGESALALTSRLARAKAESVSVNSPNAFVIGSDQVAEHDGLIIGKPGTKANAINQLMQFSGHTVIFFTALAVLCHQTEFSRETVVTTKVCFRELNESEIKRYVALDCPLDCAGSFKSEAAGPVLMQAMHSYDPTAIIGLPLIALAKILREGAFKLP